MAQMSENVKLLSEESLKFYEKKKQNGEPVHILELSVEELLAADPIPEKIFTEEELEANRKEAGQSVKEVRKKRPDNRQKESGGDNSGKNSSNNMNSRQPEEEALFELLAKNPYSDEQLEEIRIAIGSGISYKDVLVIADIKNTAEQMKKLRLKFTKDTGK